MVAIPTSGGLFWCPRCTSLNILNSVLISFLELVSTKKCKESWIAAIKRQTARNLRKHTTTQYLKSKGRIPSQDFCISLHHPADQHQGFHSQTRDLFYWDTQQSSCRCSRCMLKAVACISLLVLNVSLYPILYSSPPSLNVHIESCTCTACSIHKKWPFSEGLSAFVFLLFLKGKLIQGRKESRAEIARRCTQEEICSAVWY